MSFISDWFSPKEEPNKMEASIRTKVAQTSLSKFQDKAQPLLKKNLDKIDEWFIKEVLSYQDPNLERLDLLEGAYQLILKNIPDEKILNKYFLEIPSVIGFLRQSKNLVDMGFILERHMSRKVKKHQITYDSLIVNQLKNQVEDLMLGNQGKTLTFFRLAIVQNFLDAKQTQPDLPYKVSKYQIQNNEKQVILIFQYVIRPLFQQTSLTKIYTQIESIVKWMIIIHDDTPQKQSILVQIARKMNSYLMIKKTEANFHFFSIFTIVLQLFSVRYLKQDVLHCETLAPLTLEFANGNLPFRQIINNWLEPKRKNNKKIGKLIENIFRNTLLTGAAPFAFYLMSNFSKHLHTLRDYETLYHLFDSFIRKDYLQIRLPNESFLGTYLQILMLYTVGFINRDRLDGQTQLDILTDNFRLMIFKKGFDFDKNYNTIIKFYKIYENRFHCLTPLSKKFVSDLQSIYKTNISSQEIYQQVEKRIFNDFSANYEDADLQILQRSERYVGLQNLGNTCYMNSFMQALFMTKKFKTLIIKTRDEGIIQSSKVKFHILTKLFTQLDQKGYMKKYEVNPLFFKQSTPEPFCSSWDQHDSGQFGRMYFDSIVSELKNDKVAEKMQKLFIHQIKHTLLCPKCKYSREKYEKVFDFILPFDQKSQGPLTVSDSLKKNFQGFELDDSNMLFCDKCSKKTATLNIPHPITLAPYLIVTISIFKFEGVSSSKIMKPINLQFTLNTRNIIPKYEEDNIVYELYAFIVHIGTGVERGHYKCFARNLQQNPMVWYQFNDHFVTQREIAKFEEFRFGQQQSPYILFYSTNKKSNRNSLAQNK